VVFRKPPKIGGIAAKRLAMSATGVIGFPSPIEPHKRVVYDTISGGILRLSSFSGKNYRLLFSGLPNKMVPDRSDFP
jgi:hypothetical protein